MYIVIKAKVIAGRYLFKSKLPTGEDVTMFTSASVAYYKRLFESEGHTVIITEHAEDALAGRL